MYDFPTHMTNTFNILLWHKCVFTLYLCLHFSNSSLFAFNQTPHPIFPTFSTCFCNIPSANSDCAHKIKGTYLKQHSDRTSCLAGERSISELLAWHAAGLHPVLDWYWLPSLSSLCSLTMLSAACSMGLLQLLVVG